jgi:transketolase
VLLGTDADAVTRGGYVVRDTEGSVPDVLLVATGSEVGVAIEAADLLAASGAAARVVSMPSLEWFSEQPAAYRDEVLPPEVRARVSVEAGLGLSWQGIVGDHGRTVSLERFGASADYQTLYAQFGITAVAVADAARASLGTLDADDGPQEDR